MLGFLKFMELLWNSMKGFLHDKMASAQYAARLQKLEKYCTLTTSMVDMLEGSSVDTVTLVLSDGSKITRRRSDLQTTYEIRQQSPLLVREF